MDITTLLSFAVQSGASDLHVSSGRRPMIRISGDLKKLDHPVLTREEVHRMIYDILCDSHRQQFEEKLELDFSLDLGDKGRFRVNVFYQQEGEAAVFRAIPTHIRTIEELGLPPSIALLCEKERGLVLFTGPTGSGKSTTQAALIDLINQRYEAHLVTIEDPIEFLHEPKRSLVSQREVGRHTRSFANALRSALREDPDVILVGEMRDLETIQLALTAAETGHLVFATLHAHSAISSIDRIIDVFPSAQQTQVRVQLADTLLAVVMQSLCKRLDGGLAPATEILIVNNAIRNLIRERKTQMILSAMQSGQREGMQTMDMALAGLVHNGIISSEEACQRSMSPDLAREALSFRRAA